MLPHGSKFVMKPTADAPRTAEPLDCIAILSTLTKRVTDSIAVTMPSGDQLPERLAAGDDSLKRVFADDDAATMELLGRQLVARAAVPSAAEKGLELLSISARLGNPSAALGVAESLCTFRQLGDPEPSFEMAIQHNYGPAIVRLGARLLTGRSVTFDETRGKALLSEAAKRSSQLAHIRLAAHYLPPSTGQENRQRALEFLRLIGVETAEHVANIALYMYRKSFSELPDGAAHFAGEAGRLFQEAMLQGRRSARINLAYLVRRGEVEPSLYPSLDELLTEPLGSPFATINQALRLADGTQCDIDWKKADALMASLRGVDSALSWWRGRALCGEAEGHLVTAWLVRHRLALDPDHRSVTDRLNRAREAGWNIPNWMDTIL